jgi:hypothetical protein
MVHTMRVMFWLILHANKLQEKQSPSVGKNNLGL